MKDGLKLKEPLAFLLIQLGNRDLGPHCNNLCNIILTDAALADPVFALTFLKSLLILPDKLILLQLDLSCLKERLHTDGKLYLSVHFADLISHGLMLLGNLKAP